MGGGALGFPLGPWLPAKRWNPPPTRRWGAGEESYSNKDSSHPPPFSSWVHGPSWGRLPSPPGAGAPPLGPMCPPGWVGPSGWTPGTHSSLPVHYRKYLKLFWNPNTTFLYINLYLRTIPELLMMSRISSGTPNILRSPTHISQ